MEIPKSADSTATTSIVVAPCTWSHPIADEQTSPGIS